MKRIFLITFSLFSLVVLPYITIVFPSLAAPHNAGGAAHSCLVDYTPDHRENAFSMEIIDLASDSTENAVVQPLPEMSFSAEPEGVPHIVVSYLSDTESDAETVYCHFVYPALSQPDDLPYETPGEPASLQENTQKIAYLTFDDGPSRAVTQGILDILASEGIQATFFVLPRQNLDDIYLRMIDDGHEIGNHSFSHNYNKLYRSGIDLFLEDIMTAQEFMAERFGYEMNLFRFPGGSMSWGSSIISPRKELLDDLGLRHYNWHIDSRDAHPAQADKSAAALTDIVLNGTRGRQRVIILMHDSQAKKSTLEALPHIIAGLREQMYSFDILGNYPD